MSTETPSTPLVVADDGELREIVQASLAQGTPVWIRAMGTSMEPTIPGGALVRVNALRRSVRRGDVILVLPMDGVPSLHRVWRVDDASVVTIGDNRLVPDAPVPRGSVAGLADKVRDGERVTDLRSGLIARWQVGLRRILRRIRTALHQALHRARRQHDG